MWSTKGAAFILAVVGLSGAVSAQIPSVPTDHLVGLWPLGPINALMQSERLDLSPWKYQHATAEMDGSTAPPAEAAGTSVWVLKTDIGGDPCDHFIYQYWDMGNPHDMVYAVNVKHRSAPFVYVSADLSATVWFDMTNGSRGSQQGRASGTMVPLSGGWYRLIVEYDYMNKGHGYIEIGLARSDGSRSFIGDGSTGAWVNAPQANFRLLQPYARTDTQQTIVDASGRGNDLGRLDTQLLPSGALDFDGVDDCVVGLPAKGPTWTVIEGREDRVEAVDSAGGSIIDGVARPGASEWRIGLPGAYRGHLSFLAYYDRILKPIEHVQVYNSIVQAYATRPGYDFIPRAMLCIAFDDCCSSNYTLMFPVFLSRGAAATSFVITDWIGGYERLTKEQISALSAGGWEIASHSKTHSAWCGGGLSEAQIQAELTVSQRVIEGILPGRPPTCFAYPCGIYNARLRKATGKYYRYARAAAGSVNAFPIIPDILAVRRSWTGTDPATLKADIDQAAYEGCMVIWYAHETSAADAATIADMLDYAAQRGVPVKTVSGAMELMRNPLHPINSKRPKWGLGSQNSAMREGEAGGGPAWGEKGEAAVEGGAAREAAAPVLYRRGDANGDGSIDMSDPSAILSWLFLGGAAPGCLDAADSDHAGGAVDLGDAIYLLEYLFFEGEAPPAPGPDRCGPPTEPSLGCGSYACP